MLKTSNAIAGSNDEETPDPKLASIPVLIKRGFNLEMALEAIANSCSIYVHFRCIVEILPCDHFLRTELNKWSFHPRV